MMKIEEFIDGNGKPNPVIYEGVAVTIPETEIKLENDNRRSRRETKSKIILSDEELINTNLVSKRKAKRFRCIKCRKEKSFTTQKQLDRHIQTVHNKKIQQCNLICEICSSSLRSEVYLKRHMDTRHPDNPRTFVCDFDGRTFAAKDYIRIHMDRHRLHQILTCTICQKSYISKHTFRRHLKMVRTVLPPDHLSIETNFHFIFISAH